MLNLFDDAGKFKENSVENSMKHSVFLTNLDEKKKKSDDNGSTQHNSRRVNEKILKLQHFGEFWH